MVITVPSAKPRLVGMLRLTVNAPVASVVIG